MAILTQLGTTGKWVIKSENIKVYPSAYRVVEGKNTESQLATEYNIINGAGNTKTFIKSWEHYSDTGYTTTLDLYISGYHFKITDLNKTELEAIATNSNIFAVIETLEKSIVSGEPNTSVLKDQYKGPTGTDESNKLDYNIGGTYYFTGLILTATNQATDNPKAIKLVRAEDSTIKINQAAFLPSIKSSTGENSIVEGLVEGNYHNIASGVCSHAEGYCTVASGVDSHAEGQITYATGNSAHAEGLDTTASGYYSHAEGNSTTASGQNSHAEGYVTVASGQSSHAEGDHTTASGTCAHAEGLGTKASGAYQHVFGQYNINDVDDDYVEIVGNGIAGTPSNARTLDWEGNEWLAGGLVAGAEIQAPSFYAPTIVTPSDIRLKENITPYTTNASILDLNVYKYDYIDGPKEQIGCIAQEVQAICPEIVKEDKNGFLSIQENKLIYLLLEEVKKLRAEVDELKKK